MCGTRVALQDAKPQEVTMSWLVMFAVSVVGLGWLYRRVRRKAAVSTTTP